MKLRIKFQLFALSVLAAMTVAVLLAGSIIVERMSHALYEQILETEVEVIRLKVIDTYKRSGELAASQVAATLNGKLKEDPLRFETGHAYIIEAPDRVIFHPDYALGDRIKREDIPKLLQQKKGSVEYQHLDSTHFAAYSSIDSLNWIVFLSVDTAEIHTKLYDYLQSTSFIALLIVGISTLMVSLFVTRFVQRMQTTLDCVKRIENGELDYECPVSEVLDDEIGQLQLGVKAMSASIQARILEREQAEKAQEESEAKFYNLVQKIQAAVVVHDADTRIIVSNSKARELLGISEEQILGKTAIDPAWCFLREDGSPLPEEEYPVNQVIASRVALKNSVVGIQRPDLDREVWVLVNGIPVFSEKNKIDQVIVTFTDISERKDAEQELISNEQLFRTLVENSPDYIARYDRELRRIYVNPALQKQFPAPASKLIGKTSIETTSPLTDPERYMSNIRRAIQTAKECSDVLSFQSIDGDLQWDSMRFVPEFDNNGKVTTVMVISNNITAQKRMEEESQAHLYFLEGIDRINRALQGEGNLDVIVNRALDEVLGIFDCDRVYLLYPCDPKSPTWTAPFERTKSEYPGVLELGLAMPMNDMVAWEMGLALDSYHPVRVGLGTEYQVPELLQVKFSIRSFMATALYPKVDRPWQLSIHQCSHDRIWTDQELRLFEEIGRKLTDGLSSMLAARNLRDSEGRYRNFFDNSPLSIREEDYSAVKEYLEQHRSEFKGDMESYLIENPDVLQECARLVRVIDINKPAVLFHEADCKDDLLHDMSRIFLPETMNGFRQVLVSLMRGETNFSLESVVQTLNGNRQNVLVHFSLSPGHEHSLSKVLVSLVDITKRKQYEEQQRLAASVFESSQEGILISDAENRIIDVNPAFTHLTGYNREDVIGGNPKLLSSGDQSDEFYKKMWESINCSGEWRGELNNKSKSGEIFTELLSIVAVKDELGELQHYVGAFTDITEIKQHEADLDRIAHYDVLTSVPNRRLLSDRMDQAIANSRRQNTNLAICYFDLDGFKPINDEFGHEAGDLVLIEITSRLQRMLRAADTIARLGGDEFVLLLNDIGREDDCIKTLERILETISKPIQLEDEEVSISASIGVTLYPDDDMDADSLIRHADHAMYSAKQLGKNRFQLFDTRLERQIIARVDFLDKVVDGLEKGQFELYYQPKVDYVANRVDGVEALIRWNDPVLGLVGPKEFLPLIENDNLAFSVGRWVMDQSVRQAKIWNDMGMDIPVSMNIFPRHLKHRTFVEDLRNSINSYWPDMPQKRIQVEIVESSALEDLDLIEDVIKECKEMGVGFSLDDFGTGYSSLVYLRRLTIDELKIDQSFVRDMLNDPDDQAIVISVIGLGEAFGLRVVAEGVETIKHAWHLMDLGCPVVQGFALGRPMPAKEFEKWYTDFQANGVKMYK